MGADRGSNQLKVHRDDWTQCIMYSRYGATEIRRGFTGKIKDATIRYHHRNPWGVVQSPMENVCILKLKMVGNQQMELGKRGPSNPFYERESPSTMNRIGGNLCGSLGHCNMRMPSDIDAVIWFC